MDVCIKHPISDPLSGSVSVIKNTFPAAAALLKYASPRDWAQMDQFYSITPMRRYTGSGSYLING